MENRSEKALWACALTLLFATFAACGSEVDPSAKARELSPDQGLTTAQSATLRISEMAMVMMIEDVESDGESLAEDGYGCDGVPTPYFTGLVLEVSGKAKLRSFRLDRGDSVCDRDSNPTLRWRSMDTHANGDEPMPRRGNWQRTENVTNEGMRKELLGQVARAFCAGPVVDDPWNEPDAQVNDDEAWTELIAETSSLPPRIRDGHWHVNKLTWHDGTHRELREFGNLVEAIGDALSGGYGDARERRRNNDPRVTKVARAVTELLENYVKLLVQGGVPEAAEARTVKMEGPTSNWDDIKKTCKGLAESLGFTAYDYGE